MYWVVRKANTKARTVALSGTGNPDGVIVPFYLPMPGVGSEVVWDRDTNSVISVISLGSRGYSDGSIYDMPADEAGSYSLRIPGRGFIGLYKGLKAMIGATLESYLSFDGRKKSITATAREFNVDGPKFKFKLTAPDDPVALPGIELAMSDSVSLLINPGQSLLKLSLFGMFDAVISDERVTVTALNKFTGGKVKLVDENFRDGNASDKANVKLYSLAAKLVADFRDAEIQFNKLDLAASDISLVSSSGALLSGTDTVISGGKKVSVNAPNVQIDLGENTGPGGFQVNNGLVSHFRMDSAGMVKMFGNMVQIGGVDDYVANALPTYMTLQYILLYLINLNTALQAIPFTTAFASANGTLLTQAGLEYPKIPNKHIQIGNNSWIKKSVD